MLIAENARVRVHTIDAGTLRVDGGGMFGAIPRPLWSRQAEPDARNRIPLAMRSLLVETDGETILVDTGAGYVEDDAVRDAFAISNEGSPTRLESSLRTAGFETEDVSIVVSTHLHFDHAGGHTVVEGNERVPAFPDARYLIARGEWAAAHDEHPLIRESYDRRGFEALEPHGCLELTDRDEEIAAGVRLASMPGHTAHHQGVLVDLGDETVCYPCDLVPTVAHTRATWIMAYDTEPLITVTEKQRWLGRAAAEGWLIVFAHDPRIAAARVVTDRHGGAWRIDETTEDEDCPANHINEESG